jgi:hypothetical protein
MLSTRIYNLRGGKKKGLNFFVIEGEKKRVKFYD